MKTSRPAQWNVLDNAAKIFPSTSTKRDPKVFRFACELKEPVDQAILQQAAEKTLEAFPPYQCIMKRGLFWYYLEQSKRLPVVRTEYEPPCSPIYDKNRKDLLFKVTCYKKRINLEVYHALSDGTGALEFLRALVYHYLIIKHKDQLCGKLPVLDYDASYSQKIDDSFQKYYSPEKGKNRAKAISAYKLHGRKLSENRLKIIEGILPVKEVIARAHDYNTTLTVFLTAVFLCSIHKEMSVRAQKKPVVVCVPVNLRNYFFSQSARNFFSVIEIGYDFENNSGEFEEVIRSVEESFRRELTRDRLEQRLNSLVALERNVAARVVPLFLKDIIMSNAYKLTVRGETVSLSNIGRVSMPQELKPYIRLFDVFVSTPRLQICMCSFEENLTVSFSSAFESADIQKWFFRELTARGIPVEIVTNPIDDE